MHLKRITRRPRPAQNVAPEVKLAFLVDIFEAAIPLFENKEPSNPNPDPDTGTPAPTTP